MMQTSLGLLPQKAFLAIGLDDCKAPGQAQQTQQ